MCLKTGFMKYFESNLIQLLQRNKENICIQNHVKQSG